MRRVQVIEGSSHNRPKTFTTKEKVGGIEEYVPTRVSSSGRLSSPIFKVLVFYQDLGSQSPPCKVSLIYS